MTGINIHRRNAKDWRVIPFHILFWVFYISFFTVELLLYQPERGFFNIVGRLLISAPVDIIAAYFTVYFLIPHLVFKKKYIWFFLLFFASAIVFVYMQRAVLYYISFPVFTPELVQNRGFHDFYPVYSFLNIYNGTAVFAIVYLTRYWFLNQQQKKELENQNKESELALLRSQISPHFLFNTLNNIDSLIFLNQKWASDSVIKLSEILRYMLYEANTDRVPLKTEISYLKSYVKLQLLRIEQKDFVQFDVKGKLDHTIAPMLLIPFVENAFKHGKKNVPSPGIQIQIEVTKEELLFDIRNHLNTIKDVNVDDTSGIGLTNVKRRLELIYPGKHQLVINSENDVFQVKLKIMST